MLDLWAFADARAMPWHEALASGAWQAVGCAAMRDELAHVLGRGVGLTSVPAPLRAQQAEAVLALWDRWVQPVAAPQAPSRWRCTDPDDQVFIDTALACGAKYLLTSDKAVLKLARRVAPLGLTIQTLARGGPA